MRIVRYAYPSLRNLAGLQPNLARSPWSGFETEIDRLFDSALGEFTRGSAASGRFPVDLYEDQNNAYVRAELPGVNRADLNVEVVDGDLNLVATRKVPAADGRPEQSFAFSRSVHIPTDVQADKIGAAYENGVLTVTLPKREESKPKKITVTVN